MANDIKISSKQSTNEQKNRSVIVDLFNECPIPDHEKLSNLSLFTKRKDLSRILFINELYQKIIHTHGSIMELGVRWGNNLSLFSSLRGIYEPFNHTRKIIGFDTFSGFASLDEKDGKSSIIKEGSYSVTNGYEEYLEKILSYQETESPISHIKKFELIKGDATITVEKYLKENQHTIIALAYFDFDIYAPTKKCLEAILPYCTKGTILGFDELNHPDYPGETLAVKEVLGLDKYKIQRSPYGTYQSYIVL